ncbi:MAG TPA: polymer-forming cytoskeletal protein [Gammaproteobacteria bacterium]|jgi:cytoskeletal protein CcmA (bactofilin family)|nr:polymer-forming cytoskeletal protein [Gammaproteobacteria bacterium]
MLKFKRRIQDSNHGPRTFVAPGTKIVGSITGKGSYVFCGTIEGDCEISGPVTLAEGGRWKGTIKATDIVIAGVVEGDVVGEQRVEIAGTARVSGSLAGHSIAVAEGAIIEGDIKVKSGAPAVTFQEKRGTEVQAPAKLANS